MEEQLPETSEIKRLGEDTVRRITAEQAISDLASIVKELMDNALDAESTTIKSEYEILLSHDPAERCKASFGGSCRVYTGLYFVSIECQANPLKYYLFFCMLSWCCYSRRLDFVA